MLEIKKLILTNYQAPGDILMLTRAVAEIKRTYPDTRIRVKTCADSLFENNPNIDVQYPEAKLFDTDSKEKHSSDEEGWTEIVAHYGDEDQLGKKVNNPWSIHKCGSHKKHFAYSMIGYLNTLMGWNIIPQETKPDLYLTEEEKQPWPDLPIDYWVVVCGGKGDYTRKIYPAARWKELFDLMPDVNFVQIGAIAPNHNHPSFDNGNVINLVGKTNLRQVLSLIYNSKGVICPITFTMPVAAAFDKKCIVLAGGGEHYTWQAYTGHNFLHTCGIVFYYDLLPNYVKSQIGKEDIKDPYCCKNGGCWTGKCKNVMPDGEQLCMKFITPDVISSIVRKCINGK